MIGSRHVVADDLRRETAEEHRPGVLHANQERVGVRHDQLEVLRGQPVRHLHRLLQRRREHERAVGAERAGRDLPPAERRQLARGLGLDTVPQGPRRGQQHRTGHGVVLGLGQEIRRDPDGIRVAVGDHHHLARARQHVDPDVAEDPPLGERHVDVPRAHDLVHAADRLGAVGQGRDGLGTADPVGLGDAGDARGDQHGRAERPVGRRRRDQHDVPDAGHARRHGGHQHRGRVGRAASRDVDADPVQRADLLADHRSVAVRHAPRARHGRPMEAIDPRGCIAQGLDGPRPHLALRRLVLGRGHGQIPGRERDPVEARGELHERRIPLLPHGGHDLPDALMDLRIHALGSAIQSLDHAVDAHRARVEAPHHGAGRETAAPMPGLGDDTAWRTASIRVFTRACAVFSEARLTMSLAVELMICATSTRPFARSVSPDWTRSTIRSASPTSGASSMEPSSRIISTWMPRSEK